MRKIIFLNEKPYYWTCPYYGANLDPGEQCDCDEKKKVVKESYFGSSMGFGSSIGNMRTGSSMRFGSGLGNMGFSGSMNTRRSIGSSMPSFHSTMSRLQSEPSYEDLSDRRKIRRECARYILQDNVTQNILKDIKELREDLESKNDIVSQKETEFKKSKKEKDPAKKADAKRELNDAIQDKKQVKGEISDLKKKLYKRLSAVDLIFEDQYSLEEIISDYINDRLEYLAGYQE